MVCSLTCFPSVTLRRLHAPDRPQNHKANGLATEIVLTNSGQYLDVAVAVDASARTPYLWR
jgi:hypothetical protein